MKVKELIEKLQAMPQEAEVVIPTKKRYSWTSIEVREGRHVSTKGKVIVG